MEATMVLVSKEEEEIIAYSARCLSISNVLHCKTHSVYLSVYVFCFSFSRSLRPPLRFDRYASLPLVLILRHIETFSTDE